MALPPQPSSLALSLKVRPDAEFLYGTRDKPTKGHRGRLFDGDENAIVDFNTVLHRNYLGGLIITRARFSSPEDEKQYRNTEWRPVLTIRITNRVRSS